MRISKVTIKNYRGIKDCTFEASPLSCLIGENNAGKSSVLLALSLFINGSTLTSHDFYDNCENITIDILFSDIRSGDLLRLTTEQGERIKGIIYDGTMHLVRIYDTNGKSSLKCKRLLPNDNRLNSTYIGELLQGKRGAAIKDALIQEFPEHASHFNEITTITLAKEKAEVIAQEVLNEHKSLQVDDLPTGIENSIKNLLPEPIFITAVKDFKDDVKHKESTSFGRLMGILLGLIESDHSFQNAWTALDALYNSLNKISGTDGTNKDNRLEQIKNVEDKVTQILNGNFPGVGIEIKIPKIDLKQLLSNAQLIIDDGVPGNIESKGDGLKRAVTYSLLRAYVELKKDKQRTTEIGGSASTDGTSIPQPYLFLFEEPELYLHPSAQRILFDALATLSSSENQVFLTTHSPIFFSPESTGSFIRLKKAAQADGKPCSKIDSINLVSDLAAKDVFQILCFENNAAAFFADHVLLVEGDCDQIYLKGIAKLLKNEWDFDARNIPVIRMDGKSNVKRFREFFKRFNTKVSVVLDADAMMDGFEKLDASEEVTDMRVELLKNIDGLLLQGGGDELPANRIKQMVNRYTWREKYDRLKVLAKIVQSGGRLTDDEISEIDLLFPEAEENYGRRKIFTEHEASLPGKLSLLDRLREHNIFILSKGAIEKYYLPGCTGGDKPSKALHALELARSNQSIDQSLPKVKVLGEDKCELSLIFGKIFS